MKVKFIILTLTIIVSYSCTKKSNCETGNLNIRNNTGAAIYVNIGTQGSGLNNGGSYNYEGPAGPVEVAAKRMTGDLDSPWSYFASEIVGCETRTLSITYLD